MRLPAAVVAATLLASSAAPSSASELPVHVTATYEIEFNGIRIGSFDFESRQNGATYLLNATGRLSLLFGALKWSGEASATGLSNGEQTRPQSFAFGYRGTKKPGAIKLGYTGDTITNITHEPPRDTKPDAVPIQAAHLKGVLDPMSAALALTKGANGNPCQKRLPVFDGKERFDLQFSGRGTTPIKEKAPSGQPVTGYVCKVKYVPIAGHRPDEETKAMARTDGIEVVLRPIPSAGVHVPYVVTVPTIIGNVRILSRTITITTAQRQQIALSH
jgi:hypothetical protein